MTTGPQALVHTVDADAADHPPLAGWRACPPAAPFRAAGTADARRAGVHPGAGLFAAATGRNALRLGFLVAYTKLVLARPGPGLVPSP